jgi:hypothetical protein
VGEGEHGFHTSRRAEFAQAQDRTCLDRIRQVGGQDSVQGEIRVLTRSTGTNKYGRCVAGNRSHRFDIGIFQRDDKVGRAAGDDG